MVCAITLSDSSIFLFFSFRSSISLAMMLSFSCVSFRARRIFDFAREVFTTLSHSWRGFWLLCVRISTVSPERS